MIDNAQQLADLAEAAVIHAADVHRLYLQADSLSLVDQILDRERARTDLNYQQSLALCYGGWLGQFAVDHFGAKWIGLHEPVAPRLLLAGFVCSPIDAVRRRLMSDQAPSMQQLADTLETWSSYAAETGHVLESNRIAWDRLLDDPRFVNPGELPADRAAAQAALDPWLRNEGVDGRRLLCLAAGGGMHGPLLAMAGAEVTVVDLSGEQLRVDAQMAKENQLQIATLLSSMDDLSALDDQSFDCVLQPVSACYVSDVQRVYAEVARVLRPDGLYVVQHKQTASLQSGSASQHETYSLVHPARDGHCLPPTHDKSLTHREGDATEFVHTLDALIGGLCRTGFVIEDFQEPPRADAWAPVGTSEHRACFLPPYLKIKARRRLS